MRDAEGGDTTDMALKEQFNEHWKTFFNGAELPIAFYYTDQEGAVESECGVTLSRAGFTS